jgi:hypothetical protein
MQNITVVTSKQFLILSYFLFFTMTLPACIVDDDVRCKYNQTKLGVVVWLGSPKAYNLKGRKFKNPITPPNH